jgi:hypothetical protein
LYHLTSRGDIYLTDDNYRGQSFLGIIQFSHNKCMQADRFKRCALSTVADAGH